MVAGRSRGGGVRYAIEWLLTGGLVLVTIVAFYKEFMVISFDPVLATTLRLPAAFLNYLHEEDLFNQVYSDFESIDWIILMWTVWSLLPRPVPKRPLVPK